MVGNQYADAARFEEADDFLDVDDGNRVDARKRFVQQDEAGLHGQHAGDFHPPPFAAGQRRRGVVPQAFDVEVGQQAFQFAVDAFFVFDADFEDGADVLLHRHFAENRRFLRQVAQAQPGAFVYRHMAQLLPVEHNAAVVGGNQADYHVKAGGFARPVGTEQADDLAAFDVERKIFHHLAFFEGFLQVARDKAAGLFRNHACFLRI